MLNNVSTYWMSNAKNKYDANVTQFKKNFSKRSFEKVILFDYFEIAAVI